MQWAVRDFAIHLQRGVANQKSDTRRRLESGLIRLAVGAQVPYLNGRTSGHTRMETDIFLWEGNEGL
ncbi:MAG TPA: hypothetical protein VGW76_14240 [Pyrinomonadaceae bacterium]|nr:hypothetical protein [Pyrinomonadaceae bacterium]